MEKNKILIVEDEVNLCEMLGLLFKKRGFELMVAHDGLDGLNKAKQERPDLIILDLMLPKLAGEEVCRIIRQDVLLSRTPIIMLTAKGTDADRVIGKVIGADVYMIKPFSANKLLEEINRLLIETPSAIEDEIKKMKTQLLFLLKKEALQTGNFVLSSGKTSNYYLDGRIITLTPEGAFLVASIILYSLKGEVIDAIGGPTLGADPIVGAIAALSHINHAPIKTFIVRKLAKEHGTQRQIEGPVLNQGETAVLVDDVATTGKALVEAKEALDKLGVKVYKAVVIVDREEGAQENLAKVGVKLEPIFRIKDFGLSP